MHRFTWLFGILLLVGSLVGAGWALNHTTPHADDDGRPRHEPLPYVFCLGRVDVPDGVASLYPTQPGEVADLASTRVKDKDGVEQDCVFKKGDVLLRLKSEPAANQLKKARLALDAAEAKLEEARRLGPEREARLGIQQAAIEAAKHEKVRLEADLEGKKKSYTDNIGTPGKTVLAAMEAAVAEANARIKVEHGKLKLLQLDDPDLKLRQATLDRDARRLDVDSAVDYLKGFEVLAPFEGTVLRVYTRVGEVLGPNPKVPALEFCPNVPHIVKAEVVQEWGDRVRAGQEVEIFDDTYQGPQWQGRIKRLSPWYAQKENRIIEPFMMNDVRTLECLVEFTGGQTPTRIGQRVRVKINVQSKG